VNSRVLPSGETLRSSLYVSVGSGGYTLVAASSRRTSHQALGTLRGRSISTKVIGAYPSFSKTKYIRRELGAQVNVPSNASKSSVKLFFSPVLRSYSIKRQRSLSYPGRCCARYA